MEGLLLAARAAGVTDKRVLDAIRVTPREAYVPSTVADVADLDKPLPLPHGQVTTQPSLTAVMIAGLGLSGGERVLEVGTGYGYQAALLARLADRVISVEIWPDAADQARRNLAGQGLANVTVVAGDGTQGYPPDAPFDAIIVSAAFPRVPPPLIAQLKAGGRLVQPIGPGGDEDVVLFERSVDTLRRVRVLSGARFVQLRGRYGMPSLPARYVLTWDGRSRAAHDLRATPAPLQPAGSARQVRLKWLRHTEPAVTPGDVQGAAHVWRRPGSVHGFVDVVAEVGSDD